MAKKKTKPEASSAEKMASQAIKEIEPLTGGRVIVYTSKRSMAFWDVPPLHRLLAELGHQGKLSVIVESSGGYFDDAFKMANVIREFADEVTFIVPTYATSAATLLCLSGDRILMGPISDLGPTSPMMSVDERIITPTLPVPPHESNQKEPRKRQMAAHALRDFLTAAGVLRADGSGYDAEALSVYMDKGVLNPFLLGDFERASKIAVQYAQRLLRTYMFRGEEHADSHAEQVARKLCEGYYDHSYPIGRKEARETLDLKVEDMSEELWQRTSELMQAYGAMMDSQNIATIIETSQRFEITHWSSPSS